MRLSIALTHVSLALMFSSGASAQHASAIITNSAASDTLEMATGARRLTADGTEPVLETKSAAEGNSFITLEIEFSSSGESFDLSRTEVSFVNENERYVPFMWLQDLIIFQIRDETFTISESTTITMISEVPSEQIGMLRLRIGDDDLGSLSQLGLSLEGSSQSQDENESRPMQSSPSTTRNTPPEASNRRVLMNMQISRVERQGTGAALVDFQGDEAVIHSGNLREVTDVSLVLAYSDGSHSFTIDENSLICVRGAPVTSTAELDGLESAMVLTRRNSDLALEIYDGLVVYGDKRAILPKCEIRN